MSDIDTHGSDAGDLDEAQVRALAHQLWASDGQQDGKSDEYWFRAREMVADAAAIAAGQPQGDIEHPAEPAPSFIETSPAD